MKVQGNMKLTCFSATPAGFTMVELLISISIFILITAVVILNFSSGKYRDELTSAGSLVQSAVREAQTFTSAGSTAACPGLPVGTPQNGYGVYLDQPFGVAPEVIIFADCESTVSYLTYSASDDALVRRVILPPRVTFTTLGVTCLSSPCSTAVAPPPLHIVFSPVSETVAVNRTKDYNGEALIKLTHDKSGRSVTLKINAYTGQVFLGPLQ